MHHVGGFWHFRHTHDVFPLVVCDRTYYNTNNRNCAIDFQALFSFVLKIVANVTKLAKFTGVILHLWIVRVLVTRCTKIHISHHDLTTNLWFVTKTTQKFTHKHSSLELCVREFVIVRMWVRNTVKIYSIRDRVDMAMLVSTNMLNGCPELGHISDGLYKRARMYIDGIGKWYVLCEWGRRRATVRPYGVPICPVQPPRSTPGALFCSRGCIALLYIYRAS